MTTHGRLRRILTHLALVVGSTVLTLYAVEAVLVLTSPVRHGDRRRCRRVSEPEKCLAALAAGETFDARTKLELMRDLDATGVEAWPSVSCTAVLDASIAAGDAALPFGGISGVTTAYCNESGPYVLFPSDEHGFRNPPGLYEGQPDAVLLGDSFARGYCVDRDLSSLLRDSLGSVVNLGIDDAGPLVELAALREIAAPLRPPVVLWLFFEGNDLQDLEREQRREELRRYLDVEHRADLAARQSEIDETIRSFVRREERLRADAGDAGGLGPGPVASFMMLESLGQKLRRATRTPAKPYPFDADLLRDVLLAARDETRAWGGELVFVYLPAWERFDGRRPNPHRAEILRLVEGLEIPIVDVQEAFESHPDPLSLFPFRLRGHYTEEGYALAATAIVRGLEAAQICEGAYNS
jgi:hypothetical protein